MFSPVISAASEAIVCQIHDVGLVVFPISLGNRLSDRLVGPASPSCPLRQPFSCRTTFVLSQASPKGSLIRLRPEISASLEITPISFLAFETIFSNRSPSHIQRGNRLYLDRPTQALAVAGEYRWMGRKRRRLAVVFLAIDHLDDLVGVNLVGVLAFVFILNDFTVSVCRLNFNAGNALSPFWSASAVAAFLAGEHHVSRLKWFRHAR